MRGSPPSVLVECARLAERTGPRRQLDDDALLLSEALDLHAERLEARAGPARDAPGRAVENLANAPQLGADLSVSADRLEPLQSWSAYGRYPARERTDGES